MDIVISTAIALATSIITALITVQLSLHKFYAERWWDRKADAYTNIFETLYKLKDYADNKYDENLAQMETASDQYSLGSAEGKRLAEQWKTANTDVSKAIEIGSFTISEEAINCLRSFRKRPRLHEPSCFIYELAEEESKFVTECIAELKVIASKDLKRKTKKANKAQ